jgi:xanthine dehydrogenase YagR molybdenum-binding subunit
MAAIGSTVQDGCDRLRQQAITLAVGDQASPLYGVDPANVVVWNGRLRVKDSPARGATYRQLLNRNNRTHLEALGAYTPAQTRASLYAYGAVFAEVAVDARLGLVRVRRMLGVYDAGRIINPTLADSQAIGGMVGGIGAALLEHTVTDPRDGRIVNANLADYLVPVNADVPDLKAIYRPGRSGRPHRRQGARRGRHRRRGTRHRQRRLPRHRPPRPRASHHRRSPALRSSGHRSSIRICASLWWSPAGGVSLSSAAT